MIGDLFILMLYNVHHHLIIIFFNYLIPFTVDTATVQNIAARQATLAETKEKLNRIQEEVGVLCFKLKRTRFKRKFKNIFQIFYWFLSFLSLCVWLCS